ncbi:MAG: lipoprotein signal peptidase [Epsilonproteobacteria bacterium]|nr:lipoprotein signal peptidase [Campylobacterota bacterium]NPA56327.1 lipoprotein signal peptidase [Campylobacterota bacterium]
MKRWYLGLLLMAAGVFSIDRALKELFLNGFFWDSSCITFGYVLNRGVAFSLFASLGEWLKWILLGVISLALLYLHREGTLERHPLVSGMFLGAALGNLYDRFLYGGVIDYIYWHCFFDFAVFNFADMVIDLAVIFLLYFHLKEHGRVAQG